MDPDELHDLVRAAADGDARAWQQLVEHFSGLIWSIARSFRLSPADADDVLQTTWLRLAEHLGRIDNPARVGAWLATTARRESLRLSRMSWRVVLTDVETILDVNPGEGSPEQAVLDAERASAEERRGRQLWNAFDGLSDRCRQLLRILIATPPPAYADVAAALDMPVGSIGPTRARCLQQLRQKLALEGITSSVADS